MKNRKLVKRLTDAADAQVERWSEELAEVRRRLIAIEDRYAKQQQQIEAAALGHRLRTFAQQYVATGMATGDNVAETSTLIQAAIILELRSR